MSDLVGAGEGGRRRPEPLEGPDAFAGSQDDAGADPAASIEPFFKKNSPRRKSDHA
jgi:hypothetical protein